MEHHRWRKSSISGYLECVELAHSRHEVRDSKNPTGPVLTADLNLLLAAVKRGDLDNAPPAIQTSTPTPDRSPTTPAG